MSDPVEIGGRRARGGRRKLTEQNVQDATADDIQIGDLIVHPNFRNPVQVTGVLKTGGLVTLDALHSGDPVSWHLKEDAAVRRITPEEADCE